MSSQSSGARGNMCEVAFATNSESKFDEWIQALPNGAHISGIYYKPPSMRDRFPKTLMVGIHGASCSAYMWDVTPEYSLSTQSDGEGLPIVAFNRPNYLESSGWLVDRLSDTPDEPRWRATDGSTYFEEEARWLHELILPLLWQEFGVPWGCYSMVTLSHSSAVPSTIVAAGLHAASHGPSYPWAGMILTGFAERRADVPEDHSVPSPADNPDEWAHPLGQDSRIHLAPYRKSQKQKLMLGPDGLCSASLRPLVWKQNTPLVANEVSAVRHHWPRMKQDYAAAVKLPILCALGQYDSEWTATPENLDEFCRHFTNSLKAETEVVRGAPHAIGISRSGKVGLAYAFRWAHRVSGDRYLDSIASQRR